MSGSAAVTGGGGFLGGAVVDALLERGERVASSFLAAGRIAFGMSPFWPRHSVTAWTFPVTMGSSHLSDPASESRLPSSASEPADLHQC